MAGKASGLAARFRKAVAAEEKARERDEQSRQRAVEAAARARRELFDELAHFASETGFVVSKRTATGLVLRYRDRELHFEPQGDGDAVRIEVPGVTDEENALYREVELGDRWIWVRKVRKREERVPFFERGLEQLLVRGLGLPDPNAAPADEEDDPRARRL